VVFATFSSQSNFDERFDPDDSDEIEDEEAAEMRRGFGVPQGSFRKEA
jgi:hypothetical protein